SLEWATSLPAAAAQLHRAAPIRSERPAFELHYPHMVERMRDEAHVGLGHGKDKGGKPTAAELTETRA
ncbi:cytochrome ubiquinol oxidase subunit I, partial [Rhodococcus hoagii]|nr:cytochrome ubiquinol oxidase subunit I [Prescottella equi]